MLRTRGNARLSGYMIRLSHGPAELTKMTVGQKQEALKARIVEEAREERRDRDNGIHPEALRELEPWQLKRRYT